MGSTSLIFCAPPYCEGLQSLASTKSIVVPSDAQPFDYNGIRPQFKSSICASRKEGVAAYVWRLISSFLTISSTVGSKSTWW